MEKTREETRTESQTDPCSFKRHDDVLCSFPKESGDQRCILHSADGGKDVKRFRTVLMQEIGYMRDYPNEMLELEGLVFPEYFSYLIIGVWPELKGINAEKTTFLDGVSFMWRGFAREASFFGATFFGAVDFESARFNDWAYFNGTTFHDEVKFEQANFGGKADFTDATFHDEVNFAQANFRQAAKFCGVRFSPFADFSGTDMSEIEFEDSCLRYCLFSKTKNFEMCKISNVTWVDKNHLGLSTWRLGDEIMFRKTYRFHKWLPILRLGKDRKAVNKALSEIEGTYRILKDKYEKQNNFPDARHFYYGEMEMRRLKLGGLFKRTIGSLSGWYWFFSGYGERSGRTILAFLGGLGLFALLYSWQESLGMDDSLFLSAKVALLRSSPFSDTYSVVTSWAMLAELVLSPLTLGLFAHSIRRRFRRN